MQHGPKPTDPHRVVGQGWALFITVLAKSKGVLRWCSKHRLVQTEGGMGALREYSWA